MENNLAPDAVKDSDSDAAQILKPRLLMDVAPRETLGTFRHCAPEITLRSLLGIKRERISSSLF